MLDEVCHGHVVEVLAFQSLGHALILFRPLNYIRIKDCPIMTMCGVC